MLSFVLVNLSIQLSGAAEIPTESLSLIKSLIALKAKHFPFLPLPTPDHPLLTPVIFTVLEQCSYSYHLTLQLQNDVNNHTDENRNWHFISSRSCTFSAVVRLFRKNIGHRIKRCIEAKTYVCNWAVLFWQVTPVHWIFLLFTSCLLTTFDVYPLRMAHSLPNSNSPILKILCTVSSILGTQRYLKCFLVQL